MPSMKHKTLKPRRPFLINTRVGTFIVATIYLQLIQNRYMFRSFTFLQCSHQHCVQPVASDVEVVGYLNSACCVDSSNGAAYCLKNLWNSSEANATKWFLHLRNQVEVTRA